VPLIKSFNYFTGGRQTIGGNGLVDVQQNSRIGGTLVVPFKGGHAVKLGYYTGIFTKFGCDFNPTRHKTIDSNPKWLETSKVAKNTGKVATVIEPDNNP